MWQPCVHIGTFLRAVKNKVYIRGLFCVLCLLYLCHHIIFEREKKNILCCSEIYWEDERVVEEEEGIWNMLPIILIVEVTSCRTINEQITAAIYSFSVSLYAAREWIYTQECLRQQQQWHQYELKGIFPLCYLILFANATTDGNRESINTTRVVYEIGFVNNFAEGIITRCALGVIFVK